jgi:hypothetical protein
MTIILPTAEPSQLLGFVLLPGGSSGCRRTT